VLTGIWMPPPSIVGACWGAGRLFAICGSGSVDAGAGGANAGGAVGCRARIGIGGGGSSSRTTALPATVDGSSSMSTS
jgi:hypothetical protein